MKPQWEPPVIEMSCDEPARLGYIALVELGVTIVSWLPTISRVAHSTPSAAVIELGLVFAAAHGTAQRIDGSDCAASSEQPPPIEWPMTPRREPSTPPNHGEPATAAWPASQFRLDTRSAAKAPWLGSTLPCVCGMIVTKPQVARCAPVDW